MIVLIVLNRYGLLYVEKFQKFRAKYFETFQDLFSR